MSESSRYLFVYGTLRPGSGHPMAQFLAGRARYVGRATVRGLLYDLGDHPGMTPGDAVVHGEVYELRELAETFAALDRYEGCLDGERPAFERVLAPAEAERGGRVTAWLCYYCGPVTTK